MEQKVQKCPLYPLPHTRTASPIISVPHQSGAFVTINERALIHYQGSPRIHSLHYVVYILQVWTNA